METDAITPEANAKEIPIILFVFLKERKIGSIPIKVDSPAIEVTKKENIILFMVLSYSRNKIYIH